MVPAWLIGLLGSVVMGTGLSLWLWIATQGRQVPPEAWVPQAQVKWASWHRGVRFGTFVASFGFLLFMLGFLTILGASFREELRESRVMFQHALRLAQGLNSSGDQLAASLVTVQALYERMGGLEQDLAGLRRMLDDREGGCEGTAGGARP